MARKAKSSINTSSPRPRRSKSDLSSKSRQRKGLRIECLEARNLLAAGALDPTFGVGGKVVTSHPGVERIEDIAIQASDGKIVAVGVSDNNTNGKFAILRYNTDGTPDSSFGTGGRVDVDITSANDIAMGVAIQTDGKIVVAGRVSSGSGDSAVIRLTPTGSLDPSFGTGGIRVLSQNPTASDGFNAVTIDSLGRIVAGGAVFNAATAIDAVVVRFNSDGSLDTSFGSAGRSVFQYRTSSSNDHVNDLEIDSLGRIVVAGHSTLSASTDSVFGIGRLLTDGSLDPSFDGDGIVTTSFTGLLGNTSTSSIAYSLKIQSDGKIVAGGSHGSRNAVARYLTNGALDTPFGSGGRVYHITPGTTNSVIYDVDVQTNGKIVGVGFAISATTEFFAVTRYTTSGAVDTGFGSSGYALTSFGSGSSFAARAFAGRLQTDGKIVTGGTAGISSSQDFALARYEGDIVGVPPFPGGPYTVNEGGSVALTASLPSGMPSHYFEWDLDGDSIFGEVGIGAERGDEVGASVTFSAVGLDGPGTFNVTVRAVYTGGLTLSTPTTIQIVNVAPTAVADAASTNEEQPVVVYVTSNDTDPAGVLDPLTIVSITSGTKGSATFNPMDGTITYTPLINETGTDTIEYTISDGDGGFATSTLTIDILNLVDVSGRVYDDANNDGAFSLLDGDVGLGGISIEIWDMALVQVVASTTTSPDGTYSINSNLDVGTYEIRRASGGSGLLDGKETAGNLGGTVNNSSDDVAIGLSLGSAGSHADAVNYLFAQIKPSQLTGIVWLDFNDDGLELGEPGIANVQVELTGVDDRGNSIGAIVSYSDVNGAYGFFDLRPGTYTITESQPSGYLDGSDALGTVSGVPSGTMSNDVFSNVLLPGPDSTGQNYNFGELPQFPVGPFSVVEGGTVVLTMSILTGTPSHYFEWDLDGDGISGEVGGAAERGDEVGTTVIFSADGLDGPSTNLVTLSVVYVGGSTFSTEIAIQIENVAPTAVHDAATTNEEQPVVVYVTSNDTDPAGAFDPLTIVSVTGGTKGLATFNPIDGTIAYTPYTDETGTDTIEYTISDGDGGFATATLTIQILNLVDVSGRVYNDANNDGSYSLLDGDSGLGGINVEVWDMALLQVVASTITNPDGTYHINSNLDEGNYQIRRASSGAGLLDGKETAGNLGGTVNNTSDDVAIGLSLGPAGSHVDAVNYLFAQIKPSQVTGIVWLDFNADGLIDFSEPTIQNAQVRLTGVDDRGNSIGTLVSYSDVDGVYGFFSLRPGVYTITEIQPSGYLDGADSLGTVNGIASGTMSNDKFTGVVIPRPDSIGQQYNFGERPMSTGGVVSARMSASIGFWHNKNGQNLIKALNGDPNATQLSAWLAATLPNMYGVSAGVNNMTGWTNAQVAAFFTAVFNRNARTAAGGGPPKVDAQVLATAIAVYATNTTLAGNTATAWGFNVSSTGLGTKTVNVGCYGSAFGVPNGSNVQVLNLLLAVNARTTNGLLYDMNGNGRTNDSNETLFRTWANDVFSFINEAGL